MSYSEDLAYVHDSGFGQFARNATPQIIMSLRSHGIDSGQIVDLGCGSGISTQILGKAGYSVIGVDYSPDMIRLARARTPESKLVNASVFDYELPRCEAVLAIGECFNYLFDPQASQQLQPFFSRVFRALNAGGMFIFDVAEPGQIATGSDGKSFAQGNDWAILLHKRENRSGQMLERDMTIFRQVGETFRKSRELHTVRLYRRQEIVGMLRKSGFRVKIRRQYENYALRKNVAAFFARKP